MSQNKIIADTGFWVSLANNKDKHHLLAKKCYQLYYSMLITSYFVMGETCHLLLREIGVEAQIKFLQAY